MPREQITLENFSAGIVTTVDAQDTPINSASWSVDQDPEVPQGILRGREGDDITADAANNHNGSTFTWIVREDGKRDFIYYSKTTGKLCSIADFFGTPSFATAVTLSTGMQTSLEANNRTVRLGQGNNDVKYYGYIDHGQFGAAAPSGLQYINAKLSEAILFPYLYKSCGTDGTYIYGIEWKGKKVYKVNTSTGVFTYSAETFSSLQGICEFTIDNSGDYLFLYDRNGPLGTVYKFNKTTMLIAETYYIGGFGATSSFPGISVYPTFLDTGYEVSDIEISSNNVLWFSASWNETIAANTALACGAIDTTAGNSGYIFKLSIPLTDGTTYVPTAINPRFAGAGADTADGAIEIGSTYIFRPIKRSFVKIGKAHAGEIVFLSEFSEGAGWGIGTGRVYINGTGSTLNYIGMCGIVLNESTVQGEKLNGTNCKLFQISSSGSTHYTSAIQMIEQTTPSWGYIMTGKDTVVNSYFAAWNNSAANHHAWSIVGANWAVSFAGFKYLTMVSSVSQSLKYCDTRDTAIALITNNFTASSKVFWENSSSVIGRGMTHTINIETITFTAPSAGNYIVSQFALTATLYANGLGDFSVTKKYYYKCSIEYDNSQESPLFISNAVTATPAATNSVQIYIEIPDTYFGSLRISAIKIYRSESLLAQSSPTSLYRLCGRLQIADATWSAVTNGNWGSKKIKNFFDIGEYGPTYESESGISESLTNNYMRYSIGTQGNGYFFVGQAYNEQFGTSSIANIIFRSKRNAPDTFDWTNDFLVLPTRPLALHFFRNQLFAFDQNTVFVIDPESFQLIGKLDGYGVVEPSNIVSNNEFMIFANANNVYLHDGQNVTVISNAINISQYSSVGGLTVSTHRGLMASYGLSIAFMSKKNSIVLSYNKSGSASLAFVFHIPTKSWYYWEVSKTGTDLNTAGAGYKNVFSDYLGNVYLSATGGIVKIATNATRLTCTWISRQFNGGDVTILKKFIRIILNLPYGGTLSTKYYALNANTTITTAFTSGVNLGGQEQIEIISSDYTSGTLILTIDGIAYSQTFSSNATITATAFFTTHATALLALGITLTNPGARQLKFVGIVPFTLIETSSGNGTWSQSGIIEAASRTKANNIWLKILVTATEQLQGITIIFRRMIGLR